MIDGRNAAVLGGALLALAVLRARSAAQLEPGAPAEGPLGMVPTSGILQMAEAIARAEGFYAPGPTIPKRCNNPGNLKRGDVGLGTVNGITIFRTAADGWDALYRQLDLIRRGSSAYYSPGMTIAEMGRKWTATTNEQTAWGNNVASALGVPVTTTLREALA